MVKVGWAVAGLATGLGAGAALISHVEPQTIMTYVSEATANEITRAGFFFLVAAWLHSGRVKKEIKLNFLALTDAINNVAVTLRKDLDAQEKVIANHGQRLETLEHPKQESNPGETHA